MDFTVILLLNSSKKLHSITQINMNKMLKQKWASSYFFLNLNIKTLSFKNTDNVDELIILN